MDSLEGRWNHVEGPWALSWGTADAVLGCLGVVSELPWIPSGRDFDVLEQLEEILRLNLAIAHGRKWRIYDRVIEKSMFAKEVIAKIIPHPCEKS